VTGAGRAAAENVTLVVPGASRVTFAAMAAENVTLAPRAEVEWHVIRRTAAAAARVGTRARGRTRTKSPRASPQADPDVCQT
jgi:hypothetical protein